MVNKSKLVENIAELVKDKRIEGISDIRDESGRAGMRIVVDLKREANAQVVLNLLYKYTQLQDTFAVNMLALVNGEPKLLNLKQVLRHYIDHQVEVTERKIKFELEKAKRRAHIVEGLKIAIDNIDEVIKIIRFTPGGIPEVKVKLIERFDLTEIQAQEIVQMPLGRLSGLEVDKLLEELAALHAKIEELTAILGDEMKIHDIVRDDLLEIAAVVGHVGLDAASPALDTLESIAFGVRAILKVDLVAAAAAVLGFVEGEVAVVQMEDLLGLFKINAPDLDDQEDVLPIATRHRAVIVALDLFPSGADGVLHINSS
jgi:DNA gyrase/topoisomerase IV subunit A